MADDGFGFGSAAPIADDDESSPSSPTAPIDVPPASQARAELLHAPVPRRRAFLARLTPAALAYYNRSDALTLLGVLTRVPEGEPVGRALVAADEARAAEDRLGVLEHAVNWLAHEARKASAPGDALVLLGWVCTLWDLVLARGTAPTSSPLLPTHLTTAAALLSTILASGKPGAKHGAITRVRRAMRNAKDALPDTIDALVTLASAKPTSGKNTDPTALLSLLGIAVGVTLRLKPTPGAVTDTQKTALTTLYTTLAVPSRTPLPPYVLDAFDDWAAHLLNETDLDKLADAADKALTRAPEGAAVALTRLVKTYTHPASIPTNDPAPARRQLPKTFVDKLLPAVVNLARGVGAPYAGDLVAGLVVGSASGEADSSTDIATTALTQLLALPKAGKTAGAEHRAALYAMVGRVVGAGEGSEPALLALQTGLPLLAKETHDAPLNALTAALRAALTVVLRASSPLPKDTTTALLALLADKKETIRRAGVEIACGAVWEAGENKPSATPALAALLPTLTPALLTLLAGTHTPGEGWRAAAVLLRDAKDDKILSDPALRGMLASTSASATTATAPPASGRSTPAAGGKTNTGAAKAGAKAGAASKSVGAKGKASPAPAVAGGKSTPGKSAHHASSLVNERVYGKVLREGSPSDLSWLARAGVAALEAFAVEVASKSDVNLAPLGTMLAHLATRAADHGVRGELNALVSGVAGRAGKTVSAAIRAGVLDLITEEEAKEKERSASSAAKKTADDADAAKADKPFPVERLRALVLASVSFGEAASPKLKHEELSAWLVPAHHDIVSGPAGGKNKTSAWIGLCGRAGVDPREVVDTSLDALFTSLLEASTTPVSTGLPAAAARAVATLVFVAPDAVVPRAISQIVVDLDPSTLAFLTKDDLGAWATPAGQLYATPNFEGDKPQATIKGKDAELRKWEAEVRKELCKGAAPTLTKAQQAAVQAQLDLEAAARAKVEGVRIQLERGLAWVEAWATVVSADVPDGDIRAASKGYVSRVALLLLNGVLGSLRTEEGVQSTGTRLAGSKGIEVYLRLSEVCSSRLAPFESTGFARWVGVATLRAFDCDALPQELAEEPIGALIARMLYRLRFLSEQAPLDAASFSYVFPLLQRVVEKEAITDDGDEAAIREQSTEQLTLALDVLTFHAASLSDRAYPRIGVISLLIEMVRKQSALRRGAAETLVAVGETIAASAEAEEQLTGTEPFPLAHETATLLAGTLSAEAYARQACLNALVPFDLTELRGGTAPEGGLDASVTGAKSLAAFEGTTATHAGTNSQVVASPFDASLVGDNWSPALWLACHDVEDEKNVDLARGIWEDNGLDVPDLGEAWVRVHVGFLDHTASSVRKSAAVALADAVSLKPGPTNTNAVETLAVLKEYYREKARILAPEFDQYGMVIASSLDRADPWPAREAVGLAFAHLAPHFPLDEVEPFFGFLISGAGHAAKDDREGDPPLGDREAAVRRAMLDAGVAVIDIHGGDAKVLPPLIAMFEAQLAAGSGGTPAGDYIQESVVVLFGRLARHLDASDARIPTVVDRLVDALSTPAEQVQIAVSECLAPLVAGMEESKVTSLIDRLFDNLFNAPKYAVRRGAAYGLAGAVRGAGIGAMKKYQIMERIKTATEDKKRYEPRQGAMFATETLATTLGRLFEPYITLVLPLLLTEFGDAVPDVREATQDAAKVIMSRLSGYGVKLILPTLLEGLEEKQWRTKKGSIELLGMMAYCSPRQLSLSLPIIIPRLTEVLTDSHAQVRSAANKSLKMFGEVISNPEIQSLVPVLLKALVDPAKTPNALTGLLKTSFMHYIDHSSLALVIPIVERGLKERGAETKRKAAQIVGNLASLTDTKDFVPYLSALLPLVHVVLADPVPEARATAAKALGTLVERLGESYFPDLVPGLLRTLKTDTSGVDRQGAAQGLSEVLSGLGMERMEGLLPDVIANAQSPRATVREGFMSLLVYLPATFGMRFQPHLPRIIAPILSGLADTEDYVRDAAMRAGRMVVTNYANRAIDLLLPELEQGMFDPGWRIRQSSITLVGELLFKVSGISGKTSDFDEDDTGEVEANVAESSRKALVEVLGQERRDRILSALYIVRQDSVLVVRTSSIQIWKALVHNTPRTVRELLPELVSQLIVLISSSEFDQQDVANRTVAETCRKFGERFVGEMLAILRSKVQSTDARTREGVNLVLCETMLNSSEAQREGHEDEIITMVRMSLVDDEANVRAAAAKAFDVLQEQMGAKAIDETIPTLLEALRQPGKGSGTALQALREVMNVRAATVFPVLIPTLTAIPMTVFNARALAALVTVAGNALSKRLTVIIQALVRVLEETQDDELQEAADEALRALLSSINDLEGLNTVMMVLLDWAKAPAPRRRVSGYDCFAMFCEVSELDASLYRVDWIRQLISGLEEPDIQIHTAAWKALDTFVKALPKDELEPLVVPLRRSIESTGTPDHHVPGFSLPKGVAPLVPIIIAGLTTGSNEQREAAAYAIGDLVERTAPDAIKPFVVPFTGPLIRVATQATAYPPGVKVAILTALMVMLQRIPVFVKPFFPQLQRTFVKSAGDPSSVAVRTRAAKALGVLMKHQPRVDPVVTELIAGVKASDDPVGASLVLALAETVKSAGPSVGDKMREAIVELVSDALRDTHDDHFAQAIGAVLRAGSLHFPEAFRDVVETYLVSDTPQTLMSSHAILTVVEEDEEDDSTHGQPNLFQQLGLLLGVAQKAIESAGNERPAIARPARLARDIIKEIDDESLSGLF